MCGNCLYGLIPRIIPARRLFLDRIDRINRMIISCFLSGYSVCCLNLIGVLFKKMIRTRMTRIKRIFTD